MDRRFISIVCPNGKEEWLANLYLLCALMEKEEWLLDLYLLCAPNSGVARGWQTGAMPHF